MVALDRLQVHKATDGEPLFVPLALVDHSVDMLRENFPGLQAHRAVQRLKLLIDTERTFDGRTGKRIFNAVLDEVAHGPLSHIAKIGKRDSIIGQFRPGSRARPISPCFFESRESALAIVARRIAAIVLPADVLRPFLVARLFLALPVAHDPLIGAGPVDRLQHALLAAVLAALILLAFEIVFLGHLHFLHRLGSATRLEGCLFPHRRRLRACAQCGIMRQPPRRHRNQIRSLVLVDRAQAQVCVLLHSVAEASLSDNADPGKSSGFNRRAFIAGAAGTAVAPFAARAAGAASDPTDKQDASLPVQITLNVNGADRQLTIDARTTVLDALREHIGLTGSKKGCDHGQCGACTVLIGGRRVVSCLTLALVAQGQPILTIEGLGGDNQLHPMQQAFIDQDAFQCGYCTPGQIMSALACVREGHATSDDEIREYMSGNLCRCAAYPNIVAAIKQAAPAILSAPQKG